jgi:2-dehydro-3-deoxygluconokinase
VADLTIRPAADCRYDLVALGEVMLRLDPGEGRVRTARSFRAWEGGGEYNVARGLRRTFGQRTAVVTALVDNEVGRLLEDLILTGGVDTSLIQWVRHDGVGHAARNGLNFTERGFGVRPAVGTSDRGHTAVSQMRPGQVDWDRLFGSLGVRWLHTGGIYAGLSDSTAEVVMEAVAAARRHGTVVSYDPNYRPSLWRSRGGRGQAREVNSEVARHVDVMIGHEQDLVGGPGGDTAPGRTDDVAAMVERMSGAHPQFSVIATPLRTVHSATVNDWGAVAWSRSTGLVRAAHRERLEILDRVGGGDSFASGLIHGLLTGQDLSTALEYGTAHGALAMTTPGDASMASEADVRALAGGARARVHR